MPYSMWDFSSLKLCPLHWQYGVLTNGPVTREIPLSDFFWVSSSSLKIVSAPQSRFTRKTPSSLFLVAPARMSHLDQGSLFWMSLSSFFFSWFCFKFLILYWSIAGLQCCISFRKLPLLLPGLCLLSVTCPFGKGSDFCLSHRCLVGTQTLTPVVFVCLPIFRNGNPLQYSCLENSMDRGAWRATVHGVAKSWAWLMD